MTIALDDLLAQVSPEVEETVRQTQQKALDLLQRAMRNECRLVMRTPDEQQEGLPGARVPVEVVPGYPECLRGFRFPDNYARVLLLSRHRRALENCRGGNAGLLALRDELLKQVEPDERATAIAEHAESLVDWAEDCLRQIDSIDPLRGILEVREDILGVYRYELEGLLGDDREPNRARIELYWCVIGLVAVGLGCRVEDLTIVVLAHELGHAYTQVGADIQGRRWLASAFRNADVELKEGLAQYLCERVLQLVEHHYPDAQAAFERLLEKQSFPYQAHRRWAGSNAPEAIRAAMLEVRRNRLGGLDEFEDRLARASGQLG